MQQCCWSLFGEEVMKNETNREGIRQSIRTIDNEVEIVRGKPRIDLHAPDKMLRVCAYCRVSTGNDNQLTSYELQKSYYDNLIARTSNWINVGIYADEGITGTSLKKRDEFNRMIRDCKDGKIDVILVKQAQRFARNIVDTLTVVRMLRSLPNPVRVYFETEAIDTSDPSNDLKLEMHAMFAEAESRLKSESMKWSYKRRYERGRFLIPDLFGYRVVNREFIIQNDEAEVVKAVFALFVTGKEPSEIAYMMAKLGMKSNMNGDCNWNSATVMNILNNERRCGMLIAQKTFTPDFLTHQSKKNRGEEDIYIRKNHHEGIVPKDLYDYAIRIKGLHRTARFFGEIPDLTVIKRGLLKGFVSVCRNYPGFNYENYLFASNFVFNVDSNGSRKDDDDYLLTKEQLGAFDFEGYEKVDSQLVLNRSYPILWIKRDCMYFNSSCFNKMNRVRYVEFLYEPYDHLLAIRTCDEKTPNAIKWVCDKNEDHIRVSRRSCGGFAKILFDTYGWNYECKYKIVGTKREKHGETIIIFSLEDAEPMTYEIVKQENGDELITVNLYTDYFLNHFGKGVYEDAYANRLYLIDEFNKANFTSASVKTSDTPFWMLEAQKIAAFYINLFLEKEKENNG